jgi:hypothetical protein
VLRVGVPRRTFRLPRAGTPKALPRAGVSVALAVAATGRFAAPTAVTFSFSTAPGRTVLGGLATAVRRTAPVAATASAPRAAPAATSRTSRTQDAAVVMRGMAATLAPGLRAHIGEPSELTRGCGWPYHPQTQPSSPLVRSSSNLCYAGSTSLEPPPKDAPT